ncbi:peptide chain release factor N(5)-glutamine methyltransferase [Brevibacillus ginsengisoli]|uniref:peptide chain release factor N(5)-glutamine methyltransferase n=1 Tax=Brevibacillus ginsengisoli TaxID=363854 RepID=UPI003CE9BDF1
MQPQFNGMNIGTIREAHLAASSFLKESGSKDPQFEAELLLRHLLNMDRTAFLVSMPDPIEAEVVEKLADLCQRRANSEPIQYMLGVQEFYGREFMVAPGVLIPRPETEILIEQLLRHAKRLWPDETQVLEVVDIGTGSGAIPITLSSERPGWRVSTVDISLEAIEIARQNAKSLGVENQVRFLHGDLVEPLLHEKAQLDILVSNPPYIPTADVEELDEEVRQFEPRLALDGGEDGLDFYRRICTALPQMMKPTSLVGFEVGIHQAQDVASLLQTIGQMEHVEIIPDLAGIDRVVIGYKVKSQ